MSPLRKNEFDGWSEKTAFNLIFILLYKIHWCGVEFESKSVTIKEINMKLAVTAKLNKQTGIGNKSSRIYKEYFGNHIIYNRPEWLSECFLAVSEREKIFFSSLQKNS